MRSCCCMLAGTKACENCMNSPSDKFIYSVSSLNELEKYMKKHNNVIKSKKNKKVLLL